MKNKPIATIVNRIQENKKIRNNQLMIRFVLLLLLVTISGPTIKVFANHYTPWTIIETSPPKCEYVAQYNGKRGYLVQYIKYKRTVMNGRTGKTHVEYKTERKIMGQGGGAGCPLNPKN